jgi:predicted dehydrogenase
MTARLRVGVIGCGVIAQSKHLPLLRELPDHYKVAALCDLSPEVVEACLRRFGVAKGFTRWEDLLAEPLDAVWVLTPGSHAPIVSAAASAGRAVFVEKPLCLGTAEGAELLEAVDAAGVPVMVGYMKRYDPAYRRLAELVSRMEGVRLVRVTTLEAPQQPYLVTPVATGRLPAALLETLRDDERARVARAIGTVDEVTWRAYRFFLIASMVHELNAVRGLLGEPDALDYADLHEHGVVAVLRFGDVRAVFTWTDLPGLGRYRQELAVYADAERASLELTSPFLPNQAAWLRFEAGEGGASARSWHTEEIAGHQDPFMLELLEFHQAVTEGRPPRTTPADALRDVQLCERIVRAHLQASLAHTLHTDHAPEVAR